MTKRIAFVLFAAALIYVGCDSVGVNGDGGMVTLKGQVLNKKTNLAVAGAFVHIQPLDILIETDEQGQYSQEVEIDSTMNLTLVAEKEGFAEASVEVLAIGGRVVEVPTLRLEQMIDETLESGKASNIQLLDQSVSSIGVKESGAPEVVTLTFQVADSMGRPVVLDNAAEVHFTMGVHPGGGEFVHPSSAMTNNNGLVSVNLSSGTKAGTVQIIAEATVDGNTIQSKPVSVTIHGGLPDQEHFTVVPGQTNIPGLNQYGVTTPISVIVGDKYGNPVKPGTAVYFTTNYGVIEGSTLTDEQGQGTVQLMSANPLPDDGVVLVTAETADENAQVVEGRAPVVFSGVPVIQISPTNVALDQWYEMTVTDQNGNPLVEGTTITVTVEGTKVKAVGHTEVTLADTKFLGGYSYDHIVRGEGITNFSFKAVADHELDESGTPTIESIKISVTSENGDLTVVLGQGISAKSTTKGATVTELTGDAVVVQAPKEKR